MRPRLASCLLVGAFLGAAAWLSAQDDVPRPQYQHAIKPKIVKLNDGRLDLGGVIVDPVKRTATFPVELNLSNEGELIEYLLVNHNGKTHESLLKTGIQPFHLHTAMLLLGIERAGLPPVQPAPENIDRAWLENASVPPGKPVKVNLLAGEKRIPIENWIWDESRQAPMQASQWIYNGSYFQGAAFMAEVDGSFIALVTDPSALMNTDDPQRVNDANWFIHTKAETLPAPDESLQMEISFAEPAVDPSAEGDNVDSTKAHED